MRIRKGDQVVVIAGKDKGKKGRVLKAYPKDSKVLVEGVNFVTKAQKPNQQNPEGGLIKLEKPIHVSNVMYFDDKVNKPTRIGYQINSDGKKVRISKKSGKEI